MAETDQILLKRFVKGDEKAFQTFVNRHYGLVLQAALRRTRHRQLAEEATQNVFCAVAKKASILSKKTDLLLPWLHRAALFESSKAMRAEHSSQRRQKLNHPDSISSTNEAENTAWLLALPHLDGSLDKLSRSDRNVILQHYFEGKSFPAIANKKADPPEQFKNNAVAPSTSSLVSFVQKGPPFLPSLSQDASLPNLRKRPHLN